MILKQLVAGRKMQLTVLLSILRIGYLIGLSSLKMEEKTFPICFIVDDKRWASNQNFGLLVQTHVLL